MLNNTNPIIKHRVGLLNLAEELGNASKACKIMGVSRDTFYRYRELRDEGGIEALVNRNRRVPNFKNRVDEQTEQSVIESAIEFPAYGQARTSNELRKKGVFVSGSGVRSIWLRHNLENFKKRLTALEEKVAQEGVVLTEAQVVALEKKKHDDEASGEIETAHPGYLGSQDTFYVGTLKGVGRVYQQTFVDTYSKVACAKLYTTKTSITAADLLNDKVIPLFEENKLPLLRILTDRGTEYCGKVEQHDYQLYVVNAMTCLKELSQTGEKPDFLAGHSLGEYNALLAAGAFDFETGLRLVQERSRLMALAKGGGMAAVVGLNKEKINDIMKHNQFSSLSAANYNSQDQVVISGARSEIEKAATVFKESGAKLYVILPVSGAFHTHWMQNARESFAKFIEKVQFSPLDTPVISNVTAREYDQGKIGDLLCQQITSPVRWSESVTYIMEKGEMEFRETGPGKVLTNLVKRMRETLPPPPLREKKTATPPETPRDSPAGIRSSTLGSAQFRREYNLEYAYLAGAMANGIASKELVIAAGKAGMMGFWGTGGVSPRVVEKEIIAIKKELGEKPYGMNLLHTPGTPEKEEEFVEMYMRLGVKHIEAAAFMQMTPALVRYRLAGLHAKDNGETGAQNKIMGKISRPEIAEAFCSPAPERIVKSLLDAGKITPEQAELAKKVPMADALCIEADSGGHTDQRVAYALTPAILKVRDEAAQKHGYKKRVFAGAAGGIGTPAAAAASFILGADFILTGSINQCTVEAGTSDIVKDMLAEINVQDTDYAPAGDMFEIGAKVQVLKKGVFFSARANKLYALYKQHNSLDEIDEKTKEQIQKLYFKKSFDDVYEETKAFFARRGEPEQIEKAEKNPKHKMALIFRWYFGYSSRAAMEGREEDKVNFQIFTGSALGAFNQWVKGTDLEDWRNRRVDKIGIQLMEGAAELLNKRFKEMKGI